MNAQLHEATPRRNPIKYIAALTAVLVAMGMANITRVAHAASTVKQALKADINGAVFESDDAGILLVPVPGSFSISALTKGATVYPPPAGLSDELTFSCSTSENKPRMYSVEQFRDGRCRASFTKGRSKQPFGKPEAEYASKRSAVKKSFIEITKVSGKVMEGRFLLELEPEIKGGKSIVTEGTFLVENRQR